MEKNNKPIRVLITSIGGGKTEDKNGVKVLKQYDKTTYGIKKRKW